PRSTRRSSALAPALLSVRTEPGLDAAALVRGSGCKRGRFHPPPPQKGCGQAETCQTRRSLSLQEIAAGDLAGLPLLRRLDLAFNNISRLAPDAFAANRLLEQLRLFNNSLAHIPAPALRPLANLRCLDMSNNLYGRADTALQKFTLRFRNLFEFAYYAGSADLFAGLAELRATKLVFYRGKFDERLLRSALLNVRASRVRDLELVAIDFARSPGGNGSGSAGISGLRLDRLLLQDISNPDVLRFDWTFTWLSGVAALSIVNVNFNFVPCDAWGEMRNVRVLNVTGNRLEDAYLYSQRCHYGAVMPKLETFVLANNQLSSLAVLAALTLTWPRLSSLDASRNGLGARRETCRWNGNLRWLALSHNQVTAAAFACLPTGLEYLDLSHSQLDRLDASFFSRSRRLRELRLSGNKLKFIPSGWTCPSLEVLAIDGNSFGVLARGSFGNMPRLASLAAGDNPYHCTCELYLFLQETRRRRRPSLRDWPGNWTCYHPEELLDTAVAAYTPWPLECDVPALVAVAVSGTAAAAAVAAALCWKFDVPWYVRATWRLVRSRYRGRRGGGGVARRCAYHAFVSYSRADAGWVRRELLRRLESATPPYRLCIHERDFTPGRWIIDNIIESIEASAKVIFVLSRSFVDSEWCNYELYFAHQRAVGLGSEDVILVVKEPIDARGLPRKFSRLQKMLGSKTYLEWPPEPSRQPFFWMQLRNLLGSPRDGEVETAGKTTSPQPLRRGRETGRFRAAVSAASQGRAAKPKGAVFLPFRPSPPI
uniref:TIR domain-containing protein n=1 Tax=Apteryx owenii TaxID=8824 RepID=A0A8B9PQR6_APTOW